MRIGLVLLALAIPACTIDTKPGTTEGQNTTTTSTASTSTASTGAPTSTAGMSSSTGSDDDGVGAACKPAAGGTCPMSQTCCSDDPATVGGKIPNYYMDGVNDANYGTPLFSDNNNALSFWGHCIETGGFTSPLVNGCPVPCNPTWDPARIMEICGLTSQCCSFTKLDPNKDCILDNGKWRAVTGADIAAGLTMWGDNHNTNQDPDFASCEAFAMGNADVLADCKAQLGVANQRGYCYQGCPCVEDVCDMKNPDWLPRCPGIDPTGGGDSV